MGVGVIFFFYDDVLRCSGYEVVYVEMVVMEGGFYWLECVLGIIVWVMLSWIFCGGIEECGGVFWEGELFMVVVVGFGLWWVWGGFDMWG